MRKSSSENHLVTKIKTLREGIIQRNLEKNLKDLDKPVSYWIKEDRLLNGLGKELTIILRTKGCSWALGETGGCSMCGYIQDSCIDGIKQEQILNQFNYAIQNKIEEINNSQDSYILKIFNSGSFFDDNEISEEIREAIFKKISTISNIKEVVIESRVEYIDEEKIKTMKKILNNKHIEVAIGLETTNDYIRNFYINKGLLFEDFLKAVKICKESGVGIRVYLLFKPPFLNEQAAIDDCYNSIIDLIKLEIDTISINPVNIQKGSFVEHLWRQNRYRPPWFFSFFNCLRKVVKAYPNLKSVRLISDPSGAGTKRGIHNCLDKDCNKASIQVLKNFVMTQEISYLLDKERYINCDCIIKYRLQKSFN